MLKVLLYGLATLMETGIGVWIFGQMFPKRSMETEKDKTVWTDVSEAEGTEEKAIFFDVVNVFMDNDRGIYIS